MIVAGNLSKRNIMNSNAKKYTKKKFMVGFSIIYLESRGRGKCSVLPSSWSVRPLVLESFLKGHTK